MSRGTRGKLQRSSTVLLMALAMTAMAGTAGASTQSAVWTTQADFETNASTTGTPTTRENVDTTTTPGCISAGVSKDVVAKSELVRTADGKIYSIGSERLSIAVIDAAQNTLIKTIPLQKKAAGLVYNSQNQKLYVGSTNSNSNVDSTVSVIDVLTGTVIKVITVGKGTAYPAVYNPDDNKIYVANMTAYTVTVIEGVTDTVVASASVVAGPSTLTYDAANKKVYVTNKANQSVSIIDGVSNAVDSTVSIEPILSLLGGQDPGNVGLRVDTGLSCYKAALRWNHTPLRSSQKLRFQLRNGDELPELDEAEYQGPDYSAQTWYETPADGSELTSVDLGIRCGRYAELQVMLPSDATDSVLHDVTLDYISLPDLWVPGVSGPSTGLIGRPITIASTVANQGTEAAGSFQVAFYLANLQNGTTYPICNRTVASLPPSASDSTPIICTVPDVPEGGYNLLAVADPAPGNVVELYEDNNSKYGNPISISRPLPDLTVSVPSGPTSGTIGSSVTVTTTVQNIGNDPAANFLVGIYLKDPGTGATTFLCDRAIASLAPGGSYPVSATCTVPTMPTGDYVLQAVADYTNVVTESSEDNNTASGTLQAGKIEIYSVLPDLVVRNVTGSVSGGYLTYHADIKNYGTTDAYLNDGSGIPNGIYLSPDTNITTNDIFIEDNSPYIVRARSTTHITRSMMVPANLQGTYYVGVVADRKGLVAESNESNNSQAGNTVTIYNDLEVIQPVTASVSNGLLTYSATVRNNGNGRTGDSYLGVYLSADTTIVDATPDIKVGTSTANYGINGGATTTVSGSLWLPENKVGDFYVGLYADSGNKVPESVVDGNGNLQPKEDNNGLAGNTVTIYNDLEIVQPVSASVSNGLLTYSATLRNNGNGRTGDSAVGVYLSTDTTIVEDSGDIKVGTSATNYGLNGGATTTVSGSLWLPENKVGDFYVGLYADSGNNVPESVVDGNGNLQPKEDNNGLAGPLVKLYNDLVIVPGSVSATMQSNGALSLSAQVKNNGNARAGTNYTGFYLSSDSNITNGSPDTLIISTSNYGITGGSTTNVNVGAFPPAGKTGTFYVGAFADYNSSIVEFTFDGNGNQVPQESNNSLAGNQITL